MSRGTPSPGPGIVLESALKELQARDDVNHPRAAAATIMRGFAAMIEDDAPADAAEARRLARCAELGEFDQEAP